MPWLRSGDNAATHPIVMRVASFVMRCAEKVFERDVAVNEVFGFVVRCALESAGHTTDYVIEEGVAWMIGGVRTPRLIELAKQAGYLTERATGRGAKRRVTYRLVDDPEFLHMRLRAEIDWERQQKADSSNKGLTVPTRHRDGDACRYCGRIVNFAVRKGALAGTYDHIRPGVPAQTADDLRVACGACNAGRRDRDDADERYPPLAAPRRPYYSEGTVAFLTKPENARYLLPDLPHPTVSSTALRPGDQPDTAPQRPASTTADTAPSDPAERRTPRTQDDKHPPRSADPADRLPTESGSVGTGRDGSGRVTSGSSPPPRPRRSRRGGRGRPRTGGTT